MQDLVQHLIDKTGLSEEQAALAINVIKEFIHAKAPMISGTVDQILGGAQSAGGETTPGSSLEEGLGSITGKLGNFFGS